MSELRLVTKFIDHKRREIKEVRGYRPLFKTSDSITYKGSDYYVQKISMNNRAPLPKKNGEGMVTIIESEVILIKKEEVDGKTKENLKRHLGEKKTYALEDIEKSALALEKRLDNERKMPILKPAKLTQPKEEKVSAPVKDKQKESRKEAAENLEAPKKEPKTKKNNK